MWGCLNRAHRKIPFEQPNLSSSYRRWRIITKKISNVLISYLPPHRMAPQWCCCQQRLSPTAQLRPPQGSEDLVPATCYERSIPEIPRGFDSSDSRYNRRRSLPKRSDLIKTDSSKSTSELLIVLGAKSLDQLTTQDEMERISTASKRRPKSSSTRSSVWQRMPHKRRTGSRTPARPDAEPPTRALAISLPQMSRRLQMLTKKTKKKKKKKKKKISPESSLRKSSKLT